MSNGKEVRRYFLRSSKGSRNTISYLEDTEDYSNMEGQEDPTTLSKSIVDSSDNEETLSAVSNFDSYSESRLQVHTLEPTCPSSHKNFDDLILSIQRQLQLQTQNLSQQQTQNLEKLEAKLSQQQTQNLEKLEAKLSQQQTQNQLLQMQNLEKLEANITRQQTQQNESFKLIHENLTNFKTLTEAGLADLKTHISRQETEIATVRQEVVDTQEQLVEIRNEVQGSHSLLTERIHNVEVGFTTIESKLEVKLDSLSTHVDSRIAQIDVANQDRCRALHNNLGETRQQQELLAERVDRLNNELSQICIATPPSNSDCVPPNNNLHPTVTTPLIPTVSGIEPVVQDSAALSPHVTHQVSGLLNSSAAVFHHPARHWSKEIPTYSGKTTENPITFLCRFEEYVQFFNLVDAEIVKCLSIAFKSTAFYWWEVVRPETTTFADFRRKFVEKFWNTKIQSNLRAQLHNERYDSKKRSLEEHLSDMYERTRHLDPAMSDIEFIAMVLRQLPLHYQLNWVGRAEDCIHEFREQILRFDQLQSQRRSNQERDYERPSNQPKSQPMYQHWQGRDPRNESRPPRVNTLYVHRNGSQNKFRQDQTRRGPYTRRNSGSWNNRSTRYYRSDYGNSNADHHDSQRRNSISSRSADETRHQTSQHPSYHKERSPSSRNTPNQENGMTAQGQHVVTKQSPSRQTFYRQAEVDDRGYFQRQAPLNPSAPQFSPSREQENWQDRQSNQSPDCLLPTSY